jgi:hypothetical protein
MIKTATVLGAVGVAFSLISVVVDFAVGLSVALLPGSGLALIWGAAFGAALEFLLPVAAAVATTLVCENPKTAGIVLTTCGAASPFVGSTTAALFYLVGGMMALSSPAPARVRPGPIRATVDTGSPATEPDPREPALAQVRGSGLLGAVSGIAGGLFIIAWPRGHAPGAETLAVSWIVAAAAAGLGIMGLGGGLVARQRPGPGSVLMIAAGVAGLFVSLFLCVLLFIVDSPLGIWPVLSSQTLLYSGVTLALAGRSWGPTAGAGVGGG